MIRKFFSWLARIFVSLSLPSIVNPVEKIDTEGSAPVLLVMRKGKPLPQMQLDAPDTRPFWKKLSDRRNKRAFLRKKGRKSSKAWRRP